MTRAGFDFEARRKDSSGRPLRGLLAQLDLCFVQSGFPLVSYRR
jgi:hypothetical protein